MITLYLHIYTHTHTHIEGQKPPNYHCKIKISEKQLKHIAQLQQ